MLTGLRIENIAVIESVSLELGEGLNVLTGETGAGKSIVIDALQAAIGSRTSRELVRTSAASASVTAVFSSAEGSKWLSENDFEPEDEIIIKRKINQDGRSSASVNGEPVAAAQLRELGTRLLNIHGQSDSRELSEIKLHMQYLDGFGHLEKQLEDYSKLYAEYKTLNQKINKLRENEKDKQLMAESLSFRIGELRAANLCKGEEAELLSRREILRNAEKLREALESAYSALYGEDDSALDKLSVAHSDMERASAYAPELNKISEPLSLAESFISDAAEQVRDFKDRLDFSPQEYDELETRLSTLKYLQKKYSVANESGLIELLSECETKLRDIEQSDERILELEKSIKTLKEALLIKAENLSVERKKAAVELKEKIEKSLRELSMEKARFEAEVSEKPNKSLDENGKDEVKFLFSANAGENLGLMSKIASGGELSRTMLALKEVLYEGDEAGTIVFDEIDEGVSGVAAQRVGEKLSQLSGKKQLLCVTHLPQIAIMADNHFLIEKEEKSGRTFTKVIKLDEEGRVREIARLHGGENITETTLKSAAEQLSSAKRFKRGLRE